MTEGYSLERIGAIVRKLRVSRGMDAQTLADKSSINQDTLLRFETGKRRLPEDTILSIATELGLSSLQEMMAEGDVLPDFTAFSAASAIVKVARHKNITIADIERRCEFSRGALENFILRNKTLTPASQGDLRAVETVFLVANKLGFESIAALYKQSDTLPNDLTSESYQHPKAFQAIADKEWDGFKVARVGAAINKLRLSYGMTNKVLALTAGVSVKRLYQLEAGTDDLSVDRVLDICRTLGAESIAELVTQAEQLPAITKSSVANAIYSVTKHEGIKLSELATLADVRFRGLECFVAARNRDENPYMALEATFPIAKSLGFKSIGDLVSKALKLDRGIESPEYQTLAFKTAVKALQWEKALTASDVAGLCGVKAAAYEHMLSQRDGARITIPVLERLPTILGLESLKDIIPSAHALEPVPDREALGNAVKILKQRTGLTRQAIASIIGGTEDDITKIMSNSYEIGIAKLRKLPIAFGCRTLRDVIDVATIDDVGINRNNARNFCAAVKKLRISQGIFRGVLEHEAGLKKDSLASLESGKINVPKPEEAIEIARVLGFTKFSDMIIQSAQTPDITATSVGNAIVRMAWHQGIEIEELGKSAELKSDALSQFIRYAKQPKQTYLRSPIALETTFFVAKQLGCTSLADMIAKAALLPEPEIFNQRQLEDAVKILHLENGGLLKTLPPLKDHKQHRYSASTLKKLPAMFDVDSLHALIEKAERLEPAPDSKAFGAALRKWQYHASMTNGDVIGLTGLSEYDVANIKAPVKRDSPPEKLRRLPKIFGCNSMKEMMDRSIDLPEIPAPLNTVRVREARIDHTPALDEPIKEPPIEGHLRHIMQQRQIASKVLGKGGSSPQDRS